MRMMRLTCADALSSFSSQAKVGLDELSRVIRLNNVFALPV